MFKRNSIITTALSAIVFTTFCLFSLAVTAQGQEPQQGAINTSRSNIKNTFRTGVGRLDPLILRVKKASGGTIATRQLADVDIDGTLSDAESAFDFGTLPAGDYVLTLSRQGQLNIGDSNAKVARISITGVVGGQVERQWSFETNKASSTNKSGTKIDTAESQSNDRTDAIGQSGIPFKADGTTSIGGNITLPNGGVVVKSIGKSN